MRLVLLSSGYVILRYIRIYSYRLYQVNARLGQIRTG
jgi:hypothetical protein